MWYGSRTYDVVISRRKILKAHSRKLSQARETSLLQLGVTAVAGILFIKRINYQLVIWQDTCAFHLVPALPHKDAEIRRIFEIRRTCDAFGTAVAHR